MSSFLQLARKLREKCRITGQANTPTTVVGQSGDMKDVVDWINESYMEVQRRHPDWLFMRDEFDFQTIASTQVYTPDSISLEDTETWWRGTFRIYRTATGVADERRLIPVEWDNFRNKFLFNANRNVISTPSHFAVKPDNSIAFWPTPDAAYTIVGERQILASEMAADADTPRFPVQFHDVLIGRGMTHYAAAEAASEVYAQGQQLFDTRIGELELDQRPMIDMAGPLA